MSIDNPLEMYRMMVKIRLFEQKVAELFREGRIPGFVHLCIGQEATAVGACLSLRREDYMASTHRGHGHIIAKGADVRLMMAELFGKKTGYCRGRGGSMHIASLELGIVGANGIVGAGVPIGVGAALTAKLEKRERVALVFFGEGATNQGGVHEAMNLAAVWQLPVVFVCERNEYAELTPYAVHLPVKSVALRATGYGFPGESVDGNDVEAVATVVGAAVERARSGRGPTLIEARTYRVCGHYEGDLMKYRPTSEAEAWRARDPIALYERVLSANRVLPMEAQKRIWDETAKSVDQAVRFAEESPFPEEGEALDHVYA